MDISAHKNEALATGDWIRSAPKPQLDVLLSEYRQKEIGFCIGQTSW